MDESIHINLERWIQIITTIPEILSTDHSFNQLADKRIISWKPIFSLFRSRAGGNEGRADLDHCSCYCFIPV